MPFPSGNFRIINTGTGTCLCASPRIAETSRDVSELQSYVTCLSPKGTQGEIWTSSDGFLRCTIAKTLRRPNYILGVSAFDFGGTNPPTPAEIEKRYLSIKGFIQPPKSLIQSVIELSDNMLGNLYGTDTREQDAIEEGVNDKVCKIAHEYGYDKLYYPAVQELIRFAWSKIDKKTLKPAKYSPDDKSLPPGWSKTNEDWKSAMEKISAVMWTRCKTTAFIDIESTSMGQWQTDDDGYIYENPDKPSYWSVHKGPNKRQDKVLLSTKGDTDYYLQTWKVEKI